MLINLAIAGLQAVTTHTYRGITQMKKCFILVVFMALGVSMIACSGSSDSVTSASPGVGFTLQEITLRETDGSNLFELVDEKLVFVDAAGVEWLAPKGSLTDGVSVPRIALSLSDGRFGKKYLKAAVVHDAYCQSDNEERNPVQYRTKPWRAVHRMFREACIAGGTSRLRANIMFAAVWLGGPRWGDPERNLSLISDDTLETQFNECKQWIEENDPTIEELEAWMEERDAWMGG